MRERPVSMPRRNSMRTAVALMGAASFFFSQNAQAGKITVWHLEETAKAPVLAVGRVITLQRGEIVPDSSVPWHKETSAMTASIEILRSYADSGQRKPAAGDRIRLAFLAFGPHVNSFISGDPSLPSFRRGDVLIFPLRRNENPAVDAWRMINDEGVNIAIRARAEMADSPKVPTTGRAFILREIANSLSRGTVLEVCSAAGYVSGESATLKPELMPLLELSIAADQRRWAEVAIGLMSANRPTISELRLSEGWRDVNWNPSNDHGYSIGKAALQKLPASPASDRLLIQALLAEAAFEAHKPAFLLEEYGDDPVLLELLNNALKQDLPGSSYIAWQLVKKGHRVLISEALAGALRVANLPRADFMGSQGEDLQGAVALILEDGTDEHVQQLAELVWKYRAVDPQYVNVLLGYVTSVGNLRAARVVAILLKDKGIARDQTRYCDLAVLYLELVSKQHFGAGGKTPSKDCAWPPPQRPRPPPIRHDDRLLARRCQDMP
jgi:hypothetical protein